VYFDEIFDKVNEDSNYVYTAQVDLGTNRKGYQQMGPYTVPEGKTFAGDNYPSEQDYIADLIAKGYDETGQLRNVTDPRYSVQYEAQVNETNMIGFAAGTLPLKVTQEQETREVWTCPHCDKEIQEKTLFCEDLDSKEYTHSPCKGKVSLPQTTEGEDDITRFLSGKDSHGQGEDVSFYAMTPRG